MTIEPDRIYMPKEVAEYLRCGKTNVYELISGKKLAVTRVGSGKLGLRVKGSDVIAFVASRREGGSSPKGTFKKLARHLG